MMKKQFKFPTVAALLLCVTALLSACGGGSDSSANSSSTPVALTSPVGIDRFLLFPNPQMQVDGTLQINSTDYSTAYYAAVDPNNERTTLDAFKAKNGFGTGGNEVTVIIGDKRDLGYGRKITGRKNSDGTIAFVVDNFMVNNYGGYTQVNGDAAILGEMKWHIGTNAIEYSPGPGGTVNFAKFYTFAPVTGARVLAANLDGRGNKSLPTICINCHGGRGDALTPGTLSNPIGLFPKLNYLQSGPVGGPPGGARGDVGAKAHILEPNAFDFSTISGFSRASLEANLKELNKMVLCTYPKPASETTGAYDGCRRAANLDEYQGTAAAQIKNMYGGDDLPNATSETTDTYVPGDWGSSGQASFYSATITNSCRVCHSVLGTARQSDIDFQSFTKFDTFSDRIKAHVIDRGNMPLAKLVYDKFWTTPAIYGPMQQYLAGKNFADAGALPGHPVADPGPDRVIKSNTVTLSAAMSLFSTGYQWTVTSGNATLTNAQTAAPTFTANGGNGTYTVKLVSVNASASSLPKTLTIVVNSALGWDPQAVAFNSATPANQIRDIFQGSGSPCLTCHISTATSPAVIPPIFYNDYDRAGTGNATDATNRNWLYTEVRGRINFSDLMDSPLLRKPSGNHHNGGQVAGFNNTIANSLPGDSVRQDYDKLTAWILLGAPEN
jgi:cytochrome c553